MKIPFSPPDITEKEIEQVSEALRSGWITTGPKTKELEREVADLCGVNRAVCLNSQTACAEMTLRLLGVKEGDEVITCAYTYTASASVVCHVGAKLILIDTQRDSLEMDYEQLENAITEKTKVIIPVDLGGVPCDYDRIFSIVERKKGLFHPVNKIQESIGRVIVMADAAHAFGATWKEKPVGSIADFSNFRLDYYSRSHYDKKTGRSAREAMENTLEICRHFVDSFGTEFHNLFLYGDVGVGKTYLSTCIAKEIINREFSVIYFSAPQLFNTLAQNTFDKKDVDARNMSEYIFECDLLIIDDLGTEYTNSFIASQFFTCINERLLHRKSTIISTNLSLESLADLYTERSFSRITSSYSLLKIIGDDIRIKKKLEH